MGGIGSGIRFPRRIRTTVEQCYALDIRQFRNQQEECRSLIWGNPYRPGAFKVCYAIYRLADRGLLCLYGRTDSLRTWQLEIELITTPNKRAGHRWWFACPVEGDTGPCGRRVRKLYLPPGQNQFGCRRCHNLTYRSSQEAHKWERLAKNAEKLDYTQQCQKVRNITRLT